MYMLFRVCTTAECEQSLAYKLYSAVVSLYCLMLKAADFMHLWALHCWAEGLPFRVSVTVRVKVMQSTLLCAVNLCSARVLCQTLYRKSSKKYKCAGTVCMLYVPTMKHLNCKHVS